MRTGNPIWRPEPPDAPAHPGASVSRRCGVGARRWRGSGLHRRNPDNKRIDPGAGDASAFSAPGLFCIYRAISRILSTFQRSSEPASMKSGP